MCGGKYDWGEFDSVRGEWSLPRYAIHGRTTTFTAAYELGYAHPIGHNGLQVFLRSARRWNRWIDIEANMHLISAKINHAFLEETLNPTNGPISHSTGWSLWVCNSCGHRYGPTSPANGAFRCTQPDCIGMVEHVELYNPIHRQVFANTQTRSFILPQQIPTESETKRRWQKCI